MSNTIENIFYEAHKLGKREMLLDSIPNFQVKFPDMRLEELYQKAFDFIVKENSK